MHFPGIHSYGISSYGISSYRNSSYRIHFSRSCSYRIRSYRIHSYRVHSYRIYSPFLYLSRGSFIPTHPREVTTTRDGSGSRWDPQGRGKSRISPRFSRETGTLLPPASGTLRGARPGLPAESSVKIHTLLLLLL